MDQKPGFFAEIKHDLPASIVVFLVALPLCLGIALASGAPLFSGLIAGIVGGTVTALISRSPLGVSGPAAGLVVIVLSAIATLGFNVFLLALVIAGLLQLGLGFLRAGIIGYYFPTSVIKGMLSAIGIIIILKQIPHAFGYDADYEGDLSFFQLDGQNTFSELGNMLNYISPGAALISIISLAILILWEQPFIKESKWLKFVQGPLVVVVLGIVLNLFFGGLGAGWELKGEHMVNIPIAEGGISGMLALFSTPDFSAWANPQVYVVAVTLAIVASLETLLTVEATDKLDPYKRVTPTNLELKAQGVGNLISGLIGGLPITQVIVRSSANMQSGGKTRASAFFHGVFLFVCVFTIPSVLNMIPLASLAAILILVGYKLAKPTVFKLMYQQGRQQFIPFAVTIIAILFTDLLVGIGIGMVVAVFFLLRHHYRTPYFLHRSIESNDNDSFQIRLADNVSFINKAAIQHMLDEIPKGSNVEIDARKSIHIEHDVVEIIQDFCDNAKYKNIELTLLGFKGRETGILIHEPPEPQLINTPTNDTLSPTK